MGVKVTTRMKVENPNIYTDVIEGEELAEEQKEGTHWREGKKAEENYISLLPQPSSGLCQLSILDDSIKQK